MAYEATWRGLARKSDGSVVVVCVPASGDWLRVLPPIGTASCMPAPRNVAVRLAGPGSTSRTCQKEIRARRRGARSRVIELLWVVWTPSPVEMRRGRAPSISNPRHQPHRISNRAIRRAPPTWKSRNKHSANALSTGRFFVKTCQSPWTSCRSLTFQRPPPRVVIVGLRGFPLNHWPCKTARSYSTQLALGHANWKSTKRTHAFKNSTSVYTLDLLQNTSTTGRQGFSTSSPPIWGGHNPPNMKTHAKSHGTAFATPS